MSQQGEPEDLPERTNRLIHEKSPYLLQHAHNPVDWYPWGQDAFDAAHAQDKPIFLSIGYATCHWCHVMEDETFKDPDVGKALNDAFIPVKVDREELPEIDSLYMEFAQTMIVGSAGWPLNLILTPDLKPFFAATYLPKHSSRGLIGVIELTEKISAVWKGEDRERLVGQADKIVDILRAHARLHGEELPEEAPIVHTAEILYKIADPLHGGLRGSPKFPLGYQTNFLLRYFQKTQDARALFLVEKTLEMMHRGGIYDHLGGGFHRYAVDEHWHIPHFEKMLYDNALLAWAYLDAWKVVHRPAYHTVCVELLQYLLRDMQNPDGGFYTAEDADSEGVEGLFYTWSRHEVMSLLGDEVGRLFCDLYGIFEHGMVEGRSVVRMGMSMQEFAAIRELDPLLVQQTMEKARLRLYKERARRPRPFRDDKIITSWNGLAIHALAASGFSLREPVYLQAAARAAQFIRNNLYKEGVLYRRFRDGEAKFVGTLDDYAFLIRGLLTLFETGQGSQWLHWAIELTEKLEKRFKVDHGAFCQSDYEEEHLLIRKCHYADGAEPSGNAVHSENLIRLWQITGDMHFLEQAEDIFRAVKRFLDTYPLGYCYHLLSLSRYFDAKKVTCIIALNQEGDARHEIASALSKKSNPHHVFVWKEFGDDTLTDIMHSETYVPQDGKTTLYICRDGVCSRPCNDLAQIVQEIEEKI